MSARQMSLGRFATRRSTEPAMHRTQASDTTRRLLVAFAGVLALSTQASPALAGERPAARLPRTVVVGVDRTAGFDAMTRDAFEIARGALQAADWGDTVLVRFVSDRSYANDQEITRLDLPPARSQGNLYDPRARARSAAIRTKALGLKARALQELDLAAAARPGPTRATDLKGFLAAAAEALALAPVGSERRVVLATDLGDNLSYAVVPDLTGVDVEVVMFRNDPNPDRMAVKRDRWRAFFEMAHAARVTFVAGQAARGASH